MRTATPPDGHQQGGEHPQPGHEGGTLLGPAPYSNPDSGLSDPIQRWSTSAIPTAITPAATVISPGRNQ